MNRKEFGVWLILGVVLFSPLWFPKLFPSWLDSYVELKEIRCHLEEATPFSAPKWERCLIAIEVSRGYVKTEWIDFPGEYYIYPTFYWLIFREAPPHQLESTMYRGWIARQNND